MVKLSLFGKVYNRQQWDSKVNTKFSAVKKRKHQTKMESSKKNSFRPKWRRLCDDWVDTRLEKQQGITTPVHVLYNTFLKENPEHYMDIAQFGKVLKSRFPNQKCRRGGQGEQIYVYKNVAIKEEEAKPLVGSAWATPPRATPSPPFVPLAPAVPRDEVTPAPHPRLASEGALTSLADVIASSGPAPVQTTAAAKRPAPQDFRSSSIIPKKRKYFFETDFSQEATPVGLSAEPEGRVPPQRASSPAASVPEPSQPVRCREARDATQANGHVSTASMSDLGVHVNEKLFRNKQLPPALIANSGGTDLPNQVDFAKKLGLGSNIIEDNCENIYDFNSNGPIITENLTTKNTDTESDPQNANANRLLEFERTDFDEKSTSYLQTMSPSRFNRQPSRSPEPRLEDALSGRSGRESPLDPQGLSCRMAKGRKWVDAQLRDKAGARTFASEVAAAYARDHPDEPLTDTNIAVLIRNKFPNRKKAHKKGTVTVYYFQDLELVNRDGIAENFSSGVPKDVPISRASSPFAQANAATLVRTSEDGKPIAVVNPPAQSVFMMNGVPCVALKLTPKGVVPAEPQDHLQRGGSPAPLQVVGNRKDISYEVLPSQDISKVTQEPDRTMPKIDGLRNSAGNMVPSTVLGRVASPPQGSAVERAAESPKQVSSRIAVKEESPRSSPKYDSHPGMDVEEYINEIKSEDGLKNGRSPSVGMSPRQTDDEENVESSRIIYDNLTSTISATNTTQAKKSISDGEGSSCNTEIQRKRSQTWDADMRKFACVSKGSKGEDVLENEGNNQVKRKKARKPKRQSEDSSRKHREDVGSDKKHHFEDIRTRDETSDSEKSQSGDEAATSEGERLLDSGRKNAIKRLLLETAFRLLSDESASLSEGERARRLESAFYEHNPAVEYKESVPWPSEEEYSEEGRVRFPCRASRSLMEASALAPGDATQLLYHHQSCPGQGCSYNNDLCATLRAAYTHIAIFRHRCHVWRCFAKVLARHAASCGAVACPVFSCRFAKHELFLRGAPLRASDAERRLLREEFRQCQALGGHQGDLQCLHEPRVLLPLRNPSGERATQSGLHDVEVRGLEVAGKLL